MEDVEFINPLIVAEYEWEEELNKQASSYLPYPLPNLDYETPRD